MSLPIGRTDLIPSDYEIIDRRVIREVEFPQFRFSLRPSQQEVYDVIKDNCIINAKPSWGKAQPHSAKIRIPSGWVTMGEIKVGDTIITPDNNRSKVINKFLHSKKAIYKITLLDGRQVEACDEHLWSVYINRSKVLTTLSTLDLLNNKLLKEGRIYLPSVNPISDIAREHVIDPYLLGFLLGDGCLLNNSIKFSTADTEIVETIKGLLPSDHKVNKLVSTYDYSITSSKNKPNIILDELKRLSIYGHKSYTKFIPDEYKYDSLENKLKLVQGLLDSDGSIESCGKIEFCSTSKQLIDDLVEIIYSFGGQATISSRTTFCDGKAGAISYRCRPSRIPWSLKQNLFRVSRKKNRLKPGKLDEIRKIAIKSIEFIRYDSASCIEIDSKDKLYITDNYIVTHNTFAGLAIAGKLKQKTLVVVHTVPLRNQWAREVEKVYGITPGIIGSSKYNVAGPIVIGNVQSLYNCIDRIHKDFGTVILDEMHHVSSPTFSRVMDKCHARYKIGLSGTIKRKDGMDVVFPDYFGHHIIKPPPENSMKPEIHVVDTGIPIPDIPGQASWALRVNALLENIAYRELIHLVADRYQRMGHKILAVADRVEFLHTMAEARERAVAVTGLVTDVDLRESLIASVRNENDEIWGNISIFKEGISQDILSCLLLVTPVNNEPMLEQLIGRIQRIEEGKKNPIVVDFKHAGWTGTNQFQARLGHYIRMGYNVKYL